MGCYDTFTYKDMDFQTKAIGKGLRQFEMFQEVNFYRDRLYQVNAIGGNKKTDQNDYYWLLISNNMWTGWSKEKFPVMTHYYDSETSSVYHLNKGVSLEYAKAAEQKLKEWKDNGCK